MERILKYSSMPVVVLMIVGSAFGQTDPGVRSSTGVNAGQSLPHLSTVAGETEFFANGKARFQTVEVVSGANSSQGNGLGPRFNLNQCSACHSQPAVGGSSPNANQYPFIGPNPESQVLTNGIAFSPNTIPSFISATGPVKEARFPFLFNTQSGVEKNQPDGGVHDLFTVQGNPKASGCTLAQPNFSGAESFNDIVFRIPTPVFGAGFIENISENSLLEFHTAEAGNQFGVSGTFNFNGNDGTISRFGWKAQNKSALLFAGEAYNVEMGITNELFQNERPSPDEEQTIVGLPNGCLDLSGGGYPEDTTNFAFTTTSTDQFTENATIPSDITMFAMFMRLLAQPTPQRNGYSTATTTVTAASITRGQTAFSSVGCAACHAPSFETSHSSVNEDLNLATANLYSDLQIHHMGGLADNVSQGSAGGDQFRTAPLWGVGQRIFFLHDGRATSLLTAIQDHCLAVVQGNNYEASEGCAAEVNFTALPATSGNNNATSQQDVLNFLRSL